MSTGYTFSKQQARTMLLAAQGLTGFPPEPVGADQVSSCIQIMGVLQIDTINVVARSPYLVLWSRLGNYDPALLDGLLEARRVFEYWAHEACFIPIEEYPFYRALMIDARKFERKLNWLDQNAAVAAQMLDHIRLNGPVRSSDFERTDGQKGNWWNWKAEKVALEYLHTSGDLMIAKRDRFQRIYDLRDRILPQWDDSQAPIHSDAVRHFVLRTIRCLGVACESWCADYFRLKKRDVLPHLEALASEGAIVPVQIEGLKDKAFISLDHTALAEEVLNGKTLPVATLLSPFDPIVWDRKRALDLFDFDYRIECYVPAPKRKYGYYVLPILIGNVLVGRLDAKAHRKDGVFEVKELFLESGIKPDAEIIKQIGTALRNCAHWHQTPIVQVVKAPTAKLIKQIQSAAKPLKIQRQRSQTLS